MSGHTIVKLEKLVVRNYKGEVLAGAIQQRKLKNRKRMPVEDSSVRSALIIPDDPSELREIWRIDSSRRMKSSQMRKREAYGTWLKRTPYTFAQREIRGYLRELVKKDIQALRLRYTKSWVHKPKVVMSDHRKMLNHPGTIGLDIIIRWHFDYDISTGTRRNLNLGRNSVFLGLHGEFNGFPHYSGMKAVIGRRECSPDIYDEFSGWLRELWACEKEDAAVVALQQADYKKAVAILYTMVTDITKEKFTIK